jgi:glycolate oxidase
MGGNIAECAGGLRGLKYGVTRDYVLSLEVVLASGEVIHTGARTYKSVTGYDLTRLLVGSEGTLAIFTKIMVRLIPLPSSIRTVFAGFGGFEDASEASFDVGKGGIVPRALEFMDEASVNSVRGYKGQDIPPEVKAILLVEVDGAPETTRHEAERVCEIMRKRHATRVEVAEASADRDRLWTARRAVSPALFTIASNKLNHDVCVPRSEMTHLLRWVNEQRPTTPLTLVCFGHIGEANLHVNMMFGHEPEAVRESERLTGLIFRKVIELRGTLTGEHGVGLKKMEYIGLEIPPRELALMRDVKRLFDPKGILNPGKMFPDEGSPQGD